MFSQRASYPVNCIEVVTVFDDKEEEEEEEGAERGADLKFLGTIGAVVVEVTETAGEGAGRIWVGTVVGIGIFVGIGIVDFTVTAIVGWLLADEISFCNVITAAAAAVVVVVVVEVCGAAPLMVSDLREAVTEGAVTCCCIGTGGAEKFDALTLVAFLSSLWNTLLIRSVA